MPTPESPLRLFLDRTSPVVSGGEGYLTWVIANTSSEPLKSLRIEVMQSNSYLNIPPLDLHFQLPPEVICDLPQFADLTKSQTTDLVFHLRIETSTPSGRRYVLNRPESVRLPNLPSKGGGGSFTLTVEGSALLDKADLSGFRKVNIKTKDASAILNARFHPHADVVIVAEDLTVGNSLIPGTGANSVAEKHIEPQARRTEDLVEIGGFLVEITDPPSIDHGLSPLNLEQFARAWPQRRDVQVSFVDERGHPREGEARIDDTYRLHVRPANSGALTLIAHGSSGAYYQLAPNPQGAQQVSGHVDHYWPGVLLPKEANAYVFQDAGEERVLAIVTPEPLLLAGEWAKITPEDLAALLQQILAQPEASLGYTHIRITQQRTWL